MKETEKRMWHIVLSNGDTGVREEYLMYGTDCRNLINQYIKYFCIEHNCDEEVVQVDWLKEMPLHLPLKQVSDIPMGDDKQEE